MIKRALGTLLILISTLAVANAAPRSFVTNQAGQTQVSAAISADIPLFASEDAAQKHCPNDTVVWLNTNSGIYHLKGERWYGRTKHGAYVCKKARSGVDPVWWIPCHLRRKGPPWQSITPTHRSFVPSSSSLRALVVASTTWRENSSHHHRRFATGSSKMSLMADVATTD